MRRGDFLRIIYFVSESPSVCFADFGVSVSFCFAFISAGEMAGNRADHVIVGSKLTF